MNHVQPLHLHGIVPATAVTSPHHRLSLTECVIVVMTLAGQPSSARIAAVAPLSLAIPEGSRLDKVGRRHVCAGASSYTMRQRNGNAHIDNIDNAVCLQLH
ncbi:unnamed protein product [Arctia plantaginis]|uniref:Uncharacterized protein n=1 Tax=Arctia plantaginis TaxID=874455 RepID=A0A8S1AJP8_ARCPL|nr:unnamed protein product [Arctia plantaginis]